MVRLIVVAFSAVAAGLCSDIMYQIVRSRRTSADPSGPNNPSPDPPPGPSPRAQMVGLMHLLAAHGAARDNTVPAPPPLRFSVPHPTRDADAWRTVIPARTSVRSHRRGHKPRRTVRVVAALRRWYEAWWVKMRFEWSAEGVRPVLMEAPAPLFRYRMPAVLPRLRAWSPPPLPDDVHSQWLVAPSVLLPAFERVS